MNTPHTDLTDAIQDALSRATTYRGIALCDPTVATGDTFITGDDGSVVAKVLDLDCPPSADVKAVIDAWLDGHDLPAPPQVPGDGEHLACDFAVTVKDLTATIVDKSTSDGAAVDSVDYDFGDGTTQIVKPGATFQHSYATAGGKTITARAKDAHGTACSDVVNITVTAPPNTVPPEPKTGATMPPQIGFVPQVVTAIVKFPDGSTSTVTAKPGERVALRPGNLHCGSIKFYADGAVCAENAYMGTVADLPVHLTLKGDSALIFDGDINLLVYTRTHPFWCVAPKPLAQPRLDLLPQLVPANASRYGAYIAADNGPMGASIMHRGMDDTGENDGLGQVCMAAACYLMNPNAKNLEVVRGISDAATLWRLHVIDPTTNEMVDLSANPFTSMLWAMTQGPYTARNPIKPWKTNNPLLLGTGSSHAPNYNVVAAAVFGTDFDKEELAFHANYFGGLWANPTYRLPEGCTSAVWNNQTRGKGRGLDIVLYAAKLSNKPDYFDRWARAMCAEASLKYPKQQGIQVDHNNMAYGNWTGFAPWQQHILIAALGHALDYGYTEAQVAFDYFCQWFLDTFTALPHELATVYSLKVRDTRDGPIAKDWKTAFETYWPKPAAAAEDSAEMQAALNNSIPPYKVGDFEGYPWSPEGYPAMMRPAVAKLHHATDQARAKVAMQKFLKYYRAAPGKYGFVVPESA